MGYKLLDGKACSLAVKDSVKQEIADNGYKVGLAVVIVGDDSASRVYVNNKKKACEYCGIKSYEYALPSDVTQPELLELIDALNDDPNVHGILVQQPFPKQLDVTAVNERIHPNKDVDAFRFETIGRVTSGKYSFLPCTPAGIIELLKQNGVAISGAECVVVGRSDIVGKPMALMLLKENGTVTIAHSRTRDLGAVTRRADILVSAVGIADFIKADMVKDGAVVVDVGMNRNAEGKLCGDVDFAAVADKCAYITPVPGGVGPMTIAMLMRNTLTGYKMR
jgi:methylenetetrahydrofolate dehydrogenase (NADP+)/methenyltetrahydrofolate cyclohydrolase